MKDLGASFLEEVLGSLVDNINDRIDYYIEVGESTEVLDTLYCCRDLCERLLLHDYFKESEDLLNQADADNIDTFKKFNSLAKKWERLYHKDLKAKKKDLKKLFSLIIDNCEEIV